MTSTNKKILKYQNNINLKQKNIFKIEKQTTSDLAAAPQPSMTLLFIFLTLLIFLFHSL